MLAVWTRITLAITLHIRYTGKTKPYGRLCCSHWVCKYVKIHSGNLLWGLNFLPSQVFRIWTDSIKYYFPFLLIIKILTLPPTKKKPSHLLTLKRTIIAHLQCGFFISWMKLGKESICLLSINQCICIDLLTILNLRLSLYADSTTVPVNVHLKMLMV